MYKTYGFWYFKKTGEYRRWNGNEYENDGDEGYDFEYRVDSEEVKEALINLLADEDEFFKGVSLGDIPYCDRLAIVRNFVEAVDDMNELDDWVEKYHDELTDVFYDEAMEWIEE